MDRRGVSRPLPAALFVLQAGLIAWVGVFRAGLAFRFRPSARGWAGAVLIAAVVLVHPLTAAASDFGWADIRGPATAPAPLTLLTLGLLLWADARVPASLLVVPVLWALAWGAIAWELGIGEDLVLPVAAVTCVLVQWASRVPSR